MSNGGRVTNAAGMANPWISFFAPVLGGEREAHEFVDPLEALERAEPQHPAKIMMHQTQRLVSIADDLPTIRNGKESLQLLFLLICAENTAKLHDNFDGEGESRRYVRQFF